jgi:hypothetical protein
LPGIDASICYDKYKSKQLAKLSPNFYGRFFRYLEIMPGLHHNSSALCLPNMKSPIKATAQK